MLRGKREKDIENAVDMSLLQEAINKNPRLLSLSNENLTINIRY